MVNNSILSIASKNENLALYVVLFASSEIADSLKQLEDSNKPNRIYVKYYSKNRRPRVEFLLFESQTKQFREFFRRIHPVKKPDSHSGKTRLNG